MNKILVLGLGNELLSDDAVGIIALKEIKKKYEHAIDFIESSESGLSLLDYIVGYKKVLILDSILRENESPGTIEEIDILTMEEQHYSPHSPHYIGLPYTLKLAQYLQLDIPSVIKVIALNVEDPYTLREHTLTPKVAESLPFYIAIASAVLDGWLCPTDPPSSNDMLS
ncbi:MAG: hypothetical protein A2Y62_17705 [Candidatus Fischerbacteria bacterium RBG_13_37_8]|uniref:Hydrogenase maturation protease n=1 Tax=Candidatus Fischerbacteria bacterium RBG_13_37_8 TaxID=1817863 RepID=A0A1F5VP46_9BACT|nr:MAG: hypothetical protein A2Y62_17705 [Candidatus Fischerbacteria bacterium RBG_13_37_8]